MNWADATAREARLAAALEWERREFPEGRADAPQVEAILTDTLGPPRVRTSWPEPEVKRRSLFRSLLSGRWL